MLFCFAFVFIIVILWNYGQIVRSFVDVPSWRRPKKFVTLMVLQLREFLHDT